MYYNFHFVGASQVNIAYLTMKFHVLMAAISTSVISLLVFFSRNTICLENYVPSVVRVWHSLIHTYCCSVCSWMRCSHCLSQPITSPLHFQVNESSSNLLASPRVACVFNLFVGNFARGLLENACHIFRINAVQYNFEVARAPLMQEDLSYGLEDALY